MSTRFTEADIGPSLRRFALDCADQFAELGFAVSHIEGTFEPCLTDDAILDKDERQSWHGRIRYKGLEFADSHWAFSDNPGVYLFFDTDRTACYVGKAEVALGSRIGAHIGARGADRTYPASSFPEAEYVIVVPFIRAPFLAPAFESYLLRHFDFPRNRSLAAQKGEPSP